MKREVNVAVAGATGAVGVEFLSVLERLEFPVKNLKLLASARSAGKKMKFKGTELLVEEMKPDSFKGIDIALFSAGSALSKEYETHVHQAGAVMIDNSSAFRMREGTPLVIPEINPQDALLHKGTIANPNCSTIIMLMAVFPLHQKYPVKRIVVSTYQAASGGGYAAMQELTESTKAYLQEIPFTPKVLPVDYAFNLFSHNSAMQASGYNQEEEKMIHETHKILRMQQMEVTPTCIRVPVLRAHAESISMEFEGEAPSVEEARALYEAFPGVAVIDDRDTNRFPTPREASETFDTYVGRIRHDPFRKNVLNVFAVGDQLLKGAALNAVQIAELLV